MENIEIINNLSELIKFTDKNKIIEIALRDQKAKFKSFQKIALGNLGEGQNQELLNDVFNVINKNINLNMKNAKMLANIQNMNKIQMVLEGLNLCATVAGFAIMYIKLNKMSNQINKVLSVVKKGHDIHANYELKKILSTHSDMLDHRKTQHYYTEDQMREVVDGEYNVLCMLGEVFVKGVSEDTETLIYSILSLSSMLAVSLRYFDEIYYFNNKETINGDDVWHSSHANWTRIYDELISGKFVEVLQDFAIFNLGLNTQECDLYCLAIVNSINDSKKKIEDNQYLIKTLDSKELLSDFNNYSNKKIKAVVDNALKEFGIKNDSSEVKKTINVAMKQVGITY